MFESNEDLAELFEHSSRSDQNSTAAVGLVLVVDDDEQEQTSELEGYLELASKLFVIGAVRSRCTSPNEIGRKSRTTKSRKLNSRFDRLELLHFSY